MATVDKTVSVKLVGDNTGLLASLNQSATATKNAATQMSGHFSAIGGSINSMVGVVGTLGAVLAGGKIFGDIVSATVSWNSEVVKLSRNLGLTLESASIFNVALKTYGIDQETAIAATMKMTKTLTSNEAAFESLGVKTRDQNGHYRDSTTIMGEVNQKLSEMKSGTDRNAAGMTIYGRSWGSVNDLLKINSAAMAEAADTARRLHLVVGPEGAEQIKQYKKEMNELALVATSLKVNVGNDLIPVLTQMGTYFNAYLPEAASTAGKALIGFFRVTGEAGFYWREQWEKAEAWLDTGGALGHVFSKEKSDEYKRRVADITSFSSKALLDFESKFDKINLPTPNAPPAPGGNTFTPTGKTAKSGKTGSGTPSSFFNSAWDSAEEQIAIEDASRWAGVQLGDSLKKNLAITIKETGGLFSVLTKNSGKPENILGEVDLLADPYAMTDEQQGAFNATAMQYELESMQNAALEKAGQFNAVKSSLFDEGLQGEYLRIQQEEDSWIQSWAMLTDNFTEYESRKAQIEQFYSQQRSQLKQKEIQMQLGWAKSGFSSMGSIAESFYNMSGKKSKEAFMVAKAARIGETVMNTASAAMGAYSALASIPFVGPALGVAAAAAAVAAGAAQIQTITQQSPDGGSLPSSIAPGGGTYGAGTPSSPVITQPTTTTTPTGPSQISLVIQGNVIGEDKWVEEILIPSLKNMSSRNITIS